MKRNESESKGRSKSVATLLRFLLICSLLLFVSMKKTTIMSEGFFIFDEVNSISIYNDEDGRILAVQDDFLYLFDVIGSSRTIQIIDIQQPENLIVIGSYVLDSWPLDFIISNNTAYMLTAYGILSPYRFSIITLNITDPSNPVRIGDSGLVYFSMYGVTWKEQIGVYKNYTYISSLNELEIYDCSNLTFPVKVESFPSSGGNLFIKDDLLYLVWDGVKIYSLADPLNPTYRGDISSTKTITTGCGVYGTYVFNAFNESGLQCYDCSDFLQPFICADYDFPDWQLYVDGTIQDIAIAGDRLFTGGKEVYVFDISKPHKLNRIARLTIGNPDLTQITVANNYLYLTTPGNIRIFSYIENALGRNLGIGLGIGLPIIIGISFLIYKRKRKF